MGQSNSSLDRKVPWKQTVNAVRALQFSTAESGISSQISGQPFRCRHPWLDAAVGPLWPLHGGNRPACNPRPPWNSIL